MRELVQGMEHLDEIKGYIIYKQDTTKAEISEADQKLFNPFEFEIVKKFEGKIV